MDIYAQLADERKNSVYKELVDLMLLAQQNGALSPDDADYAHSYILNHLDTLPNELYLKAFLEELVEQWNCFQPILLSYQASAVGKQEAQKIQTIENEIQNLTNSQ